MTSLKSGQLWGASSQPGSCLTLSGHHLTMSPDCHAAEGLLYFIGEKGQQCLPDHTVAILIPTIHRPTHPAKGPSREQISQLHSVHRELKNKSDQDTFTPLGQQAPGEESVPENEPEACSCGCCGAQAPRAASLHPHHHYR